MEVSMSMAALSAALSVVVGALLGAVYDVIRFFRVLLGVDVRSPFVKKGQKRRWGAWLSYGVVALGDLFFFVVAAVCMCVFFFLTGDGRMRAYGLLGAFGGFWLYYHTVGRLFIGICTYLSALCKRILRWLLQKSLVPFRYVFAICQKIALRILGLPIVSRAFTRYNEYVCRKKETAARRKRKRRMQKSGYCKNG
ncbi:MAG: spore cortex biosynthesis protein YabQ [Clostridia bacterium]|nr:spore cortex biosynthesis protein YabQ [Clostridia bacterium]